MIEAVVFPCTYKCNGRCIMCTIYKRKGSDLPVSFFETFFSHPALRQLKSVNITGGEPTLRKDIIRLIEMINLHCSSLKEIIINTNGFCTEQIVKQISKICENLRSRIKLWVYVSLDALDDTSEIIRGVRQAHLKAMKTIEDLTLLRKKYLGLQVGISCTITSKNYDKLESVYRYAMGLDIYVDFIYATINTAYINSEPNKDEFMLNASQVSSVIRFFEKMEANAKISTAKDYYKRLIKKLQGDRTCGSCIFRDGKGLLLEADGKVSLCGMTNESLIGNLHTQTMDEILQYSLNGLDKYCAQCQTDSYYNWSVEAQEKIKFEMINSIKRKRQEEYPERIHK